MKINLYNPPQFLKDSLKKIEKVFDKYFESKLKNNQIDVNFVSREKVLEFTEKYKGLAHYTDVLSFPLVFADSSTLKEGELLGEVYICPEIVKQNAKEAGVTYEQEVLEVLIHGCLHLLGYNHIGSKDNQEPGDAEMFSMQETLLKEIKA